MLFDYDAAFVAYINGYEFKRVNIGKAWDITAHTEVGDVERKAKLVDNGDYEEYIFKDYQINNRIKNGDNVLAIQIHSSSTSPTKLAAFFNYHPCSSCTFSPIIFIIPGVNDRPREDVRGRSWERVRRYGPA